MQPRAPSTMTQTVPCKQCSQNWVCTDTYTTIKHHQVQRDFDVYTKFSCCRNNFLKFIFIRDVQEKTIDKDTQGPLACLSSNTWPKYQTAEMNLEVVIQMIHRPFSEPERTGARLRALQQLSLCLAFASPGCHMASELLAPRVVLPLQNLIGHPVTSVSIMSLTAGTRAVVLIPLGLLRFQVPTVVQKE